MRLQERDSFSSADWGAIVGEEQQVWGGGAGESFAWVDKQRFLAALGEDGAAVGVIGALQAEVQAAGERFPVVGIGGLVVTAALRGRGVGTQLLEGMLEIAKGLGPERAMLFCEPALVARYSRHGFSTIEEPVSVDQPGGRVEMPMEAMWRPLRAGADWPAGPVGVLGMPF